MYHIRYLLKGDVGHHALYCSSVYNIITYYDVLIEVVMNLEELQYEKKYQCWKKEICPL